VFVLSCEMLPQPHSMIPKKESRMNMLVRNDAGLSSLEKTLLVPCRRLIGRPTFFMHINSTSLLCYALHKRQC
jgi:hypothetical protein